MTLSRGELLPKRRGFSRLIRAGWFPFSLMVLCLLGARQTVFILVDQPWYPVVGVFLVLMILGLIFFLDTLARVSDYRRYSTTNRMKNSLGVLTNLRKSFCARQVAIALFGDTAKKFYRTLGYRWYHVFPDGMFRWDSVLFKRPFWRTVLWGRR